MPVKSTPRQKQEVVVEPEPEMQPEPQMELEPEPELKPDPRPKLETAVIEVPLGDIGSGEYLSRHIEGRLKTTRQQLAMKRLLRGLQQSGATTADGRPVQRPGEALRWLAEQISDSD